MTQQLYTHLGTSKIISASNVITKIADGYQQRLTTHNSRTSERQNEKRGSDPWGRFALTETRGTRDEGIVTFSAYRVSQKKGTNAGPFTSYSQQVDQIIKEGDLSLDPRMRILPDLKHLITDVGVGTLANGYIKSAPPATCNCQSSTRNSSYKQMPSADTSPVWTGPSPAFVPHD